MTRRRKYWGKKLYKRRIWMETTPDGKVYAWLRDEMQRMLDEEISRVAIRGVREQKPSLTAQDITDARDKLRNDYKSSWMGQMGISVINND